ncbi:hypothetical protein, partial [Streptomyces sp. NPDC005093]
MWGPLRDRCHGLSVKSSGRSRGSVCTGLRTAAVEGEDEIALDRDAECEVLGAGNMLDGLGELVDGAQAGA